MPYEQNLAIYLCLFIRNNVIYIDFIYTVYLNNMYRKTTIIISFLYIQ